MMMPTTHLLALTSLLLLSSHGFARARSLASLNTAASAESSMAVTTDSAGLWGPAITSTSATTEDLTAYAAKRGGQLLYSYATPNWSSLGGTATSKPAAAAYAGTNLVSVVGTSENLWFITQTPHAGSGGEVSWKSYPDLSCMDHDGENIKIFRKVSLSSCKRTCEDYSECQAVTYSSSSDCYLKRSCRDKVARNNGDESAVLTRGGGSSDTTWLDYTDLSCMDNGGDNYKIYRDVGSMDDCKRECVAESICWAVTYSSSDACYLKQSCRKLEARHNGDNSAILTSRGGGGGGGGGGGDWVEVPGGKCSSAPAVAAVHGRFDLFCVGTDGQPYVHQVIDGSPSGHWSALGGGVKPGTAPAATGNIDNKKSFVVVVGTDSRLWWTKSNSEGQGWGSWPGSLPMPGEPVRGSPALAYLSNKMYLFVVGSSGRPFFMTLDDNGNVRSAWTKLGNANCVSDMAATMGCPWGESNCVTAACFGTDNQLWYLPISGGNSFGAWTATGLFSP